MILKFYLLLIQNGGKIENEDVRQLNHFNRRQMKIFFYSNTKYQEVQNNTFPLIFTFTTLKVTNSHENSDKFTRLIFNQKQLLRVGE